MAASAGFEPAYPGSKPSVLPLNDKAILVREGRVELPRPFDHWFLRPAWLPVTSLARTGGSGKTRTSVARRQLGYSQSSLPLDYATEIWCDERESNSHDPKATSPSNWRGYRYATVAMVRCAGLEPASPFGHPFLRRTRLPISQQRVLVRLAGFEPASPCGDRILSAACIPFQPEARLASKRVEVAPE